MRLEASSFKVILGNAIWEACVVEEREASERWAPKDTDLTGRIWQESESATSPLLFGITMLFVTVMSWGPLLTVVSLWPASGTNSRFL